MERSGRPGQVHQTQKAAKPPSSYNAAGEPTLVVDPDGHETEFGYDSRGNRTGPTDPLGHETTFGYDSRNYLTSRALPGLEAEEFWPRRLRRHALAHHP